jgi:hypothetical protein
MRTPRLPVDDWTDTPADLNGLVRFVERRILFSKRVPSHFKRSLHSPNVSLVIVIVFPRFRYTRPLDIPGDNDCQHTQTPVIWYDIWYDMIWYDMIWYDMIWYDMIWYDMIWYDMIWYDMMWCDVMWYMMWCDVMWYDIWYVIYDMIYDIWYVIYDMWYMIWYDIWYDITALRSIT